MSSAKRLPPEVRKEQIIQAVLELAENTHYTQISRQRIAERMCCKSAAINYHFGSMLHLREDVLRAAIEQKNLCVIAQAMSVRALSNDIPVELRRKAAEKMFTDS